ncbi:MAG: hypothetical protein JXR03_11550 [Cyclobacteriaceae bacterium]
MLYAQDWQLVKKIDPKEGITSISIDTKNYFYLGTTEGNIIRYDDNGEEDEYFSNLNSSHVTNIQAWNRLKVFVFFRDQQSISILDRFTTTPKNIDLKDIGLQYAWLFSPGIDNSYWALSTELKELIKYDDQNLNILFRIPLKNDINLEEASFIRAYKNLLILVDLKSGIWVFDQYGDFKGNIEETNIHHIQIVNNLIHASSESEYLVIDPFELKVLERKKAPKGAFWSVVTSGDRYIFFSKSEVAIYKLD